MSQAVGQKTIKTQCERRVKLSDVSPNADAVTCPECIEVYLDFQIGAEELMREEPYRWPEGVPDVNAL
jgi:hypothetical protein